MVTLAALRLNPSCLPELKAKAGGVALPVPVSQCIEVLTYPLMVVDERAVQTLFILSLSSASASAGMLTSPSAARLVVHLFTFILCSFRLFVLFCLRFPRVAFGSGADAQPVRSSRIAA